MAKTIIHPFLKLFLWGIEVPTSVKCFFCLPQYILINTILNSLMELQHISQIKAKLWGPLPSRGRNLQ